MVFGKTDESSSFEYTVDKAEKVEKRLIPLLQDESEPYQKLMGVQDLEGLHNHIIVLLS